MNDHVPVKDIQTVVPVSTPHGEIIRELGGHSAGGLSQHSMAHITLLPLKSALKHYHPVVEESYYILSGTAQMELDGAEQVLEPGQMVAIAPGKVHTIHNLSSSEALTFLVVCTPPWTPDCSVFVEE